MVFVRRELEYEIQVETSRCSSEILLTPKASLHRQTVPSRESRLRRLAKEHLAAAESREEHRYRLLRTDR